MAVSPALDGITLAPEDTEWFRSTFQWMDSFYNLKRDIFEITFGELKVKLNTDFNGKGKILTLSPSNLPGEEKIWLSITLGEWHSSDERDIVYIYSMIGLLTAALVAGTLSNRLYKFPLSQEEWRVLSDSHDAVVGQMLLQTWLVTRGTK